ncbi:MAG: CoA ester lyase [Armatimonadota bacterium]|nr:CoA ester lyase [Armatimonadota bacterium]MDR7485034.1 CoA ester lyase [Armatimonadota bacterium]MDR7534490.1 CoA ester lyase [Armatimonadota bacterium]MDR7535548.1 CoA ester lyase [Armatimonadota bacterium]
MPPGGPASGAAVARPRRSLLFVPADQPLKLRKAATVPCDGVILDLEDGVAPGRKADARAGALEALRDLPLAPRERLVRINALASPWGHDDLAAVRTADVLPDVVVIPKVQGPDDVRAVARALAGTGVGLLPHIESARSLLRAAEIAGCCEEVVGLFFGAGDLLVETGGQRTPLSLLYPRSVVATAAAAAGVVAIDTPWFRLGDLVGLEDDARDAADLGFAGKAAIHPEQIDVINRVFTPSPERVAWAERVLDVAARQTAGAWVVDGEMADAMTVRVAKRIVAAARALGVQGEADDG